MEEELSFHPRILDILSVLCKEGTAATLILSNLLKDIIGSHEAHSRALLKASQRAREGLVELGLVEGGAAASCPLGSVSWTVSELAGSTAALGRGHYNLVVRAKPAVAALDEALRAHGQATRAALAEAKAAEDALAAARGAAASARLSYSQVSGFVDRSVAAIAALASELPAMPSQQLKPLFYDIAPDLDKKNAVAEVCRQAHSRLAEARGRRDTMAREAVKVVTQAEEARLAATAAALTMFGELSSEAGTRIKTDLSTLLSTVTQHCHPTEDAEKVLLERVKTAARDQRRPEPEQDFHPANVSLPIPKPLLLFLEQFRKKNRPGVTPSSPSPTPSPLASSPAPHQDQPPLSGEDDLLEGLETGADRDTALSLNVAVGALFEVGWRPSSANKPSELEELLATAKGRSLFCRVLHQRRQRPEVPEEAAFEQLGRWCQVVAAGAAASQPLEHAVLRQLIVILSTFFISVEGVRCYLQDDARGEATWQSPGLWEELFYSSVQAELAAFREASGGSTEDQDHLRSVVVAKMVPVVKGMSEFGLEGALIEDFIDRTLRAHSVEAEYRDMIVGQFAALKRERELSQSSNPAPNPPSQASTPGQPQTGRGGDVGVEEGDDPSNSPDWFKGSFEERMSLSKHLKSMGNQLFNERQFSEAYAAYQKSIRILSVPLSGLSETKRAAALVLSCQLNASACCVQENQLDAALLHAKRALAIDPGNAKGYYRLAMAEARKGLIVQALRHLKEAKKSLDDEMLDKELARLSLLLRLSRTVIAAIEGIPQEGL